MDMDINRSCSPRNGLPTSSSVTTFLEALNMIETWKDDLLDDFQN